MVSNYDENNQEAVIKLGKEVNKNFANLFNVKKLPDNERIFVYKEDDQVLGFLHILTNIDVIEILNLIVDSKRQGEGIASILLDYLLSSQELNVSKIILEVRESNIPAINLYKKFNFLIINIRENYYRDENALVMERDLT